MRFNQPSFPLQRQFLFGRQVKHILRCENLLTVIQNGILRHGFILFCTEDQANGGIVVRSGILSVKHADIAIHLSHIPVRYLSYFEVDQQVAFEDAVIKDQINIEIGILKAQTFLVGNKGKALAKLQEEVLQVGDEHPLGVKSLWNYLQGKILRPPGVQLGIVQYMPDKTF